MKSRRILIATFVGLSVSAATFGAAASLGITNDSLQAGGVLAADCDTDGFSYRYTVTYDTAADIYRVISVGVDGIDPACVGGTISVNLANAGGASLGSAGPVLLSATSMSLAIAAQPNRANVVELDLGIVSP